MIRTEIHILRALHKMGMSDRSRANADVRRERDALDRLANVVQCYVNVLRRSADHI